MPAPSPEREAEAKRRGVEAAKCMRLGHCWHVSEEQHTIDRHRDDMCCWCGAHRCVRVERPGCGDGRHWHGPIHRYLGEMVRDGD